jgi:hypothetical protein
MKNEGQTNGELLAALAPLSRWLKRELGKLAEWSAKIDQAPFVDGLNKLAEWARKIDPAIFVDGRLQRHFVTLVANEACARSDLTDAERVRIKNDLEIFRADFAQIIESEEVCGKQIVLSAVERALLIGCSAGISPEKMRAIREAQLKAAHNARQAGDIQEIIDRLALGHWSSKPSFKKTILGTATAIQPAFNREIATWEKVPTEWEPADSNDPNAVEREIDRIRKRIKRPEALDD